MEQQHDWSLEFFTALEERDRIITKKARVALINELRGWIAEARGKTWAGFVNPDPLLVKLDELERGE